MSLSDRAVLVKLTISVWNGKKLDKNVTDEVVNAHNADKQAGRFNKSLFPNDARLKNIYAKTVSIRNIYYKNTLPWDFEGVALLPTENYIDFMDTMKKEKAEWRILVDELLNNYENMKQNAKQALQTLYNEDDYPPVEKIRSKFKFDIAVFPVPINDFRIELNKDEINKIKQDVENRLKNAEQKAMYDLWQRLYNQIQKIVDKLSVPDAIFRNSLIENTWELCGLLTKLNISKDKDLEAMQKEIEQKLLSYDPDNLRKDKEFRKQKANEAKEIVNKIMDKMVMYK